VRSFEAGVPLLASVPADVARALADVDVGRGLEGLRVAQLPGLLEQSPCSRVPRVTDRGARA
jgi:hypothetical protein